MDFFNKFKFTNTSIALQKDQTLTELTVDQKEAWNSMCEAAQSMQYWATTKDYMKQEEIDERVRRFDEANCTLPKEYQLPPASTWASGENYDKYIGFFSLLDGEKPSTEYAVATTDLLSQDELWEKYKDVCSKYKDAKTGLLSPQTCPNLYKAFFWGSKLEPQLNLYLNESNAAFLSQCKERPSEDIINMMTELGAYVPSKTFTAKDLKRKQEACEDSLIWLQWRDLFSRMMEYPSRTPPDYPEETPKGFDVIDDTVDEPTDNSIGMDETEQEEEEDFSTEVMAAWSQVIQQSKEAMANYKWDENAEQAYLAFEEANNQLPDSIKLFPIRNHISAAKIYKDFKPEKVTSAAKSFTVRTVGKLSNQELWNNIQTSVKQAREDEKSNVSAITDACFWTARLSDRLQPLKTGGLNSDSGTVWAYGALPKELPSKGVLDLFNKRLNCNFFCEKSTDDVWADMKRLSKVEKFVEKVDWVKEIWDAEKTKMTEQSEANEESVE